jgi:hypothetical protein
LAWLELEEIWQEFYQLHCSPLMWVSGLAALEETKGILLVCNYINKLKKNILEIITISYLLKSLRSIYLNICRLLKWNTFSLNFKTDQQKVIKLECHFTIVGLDLTGPFEVHSFE